MASDVRRRVLKVTVEPIKFLGIKVPFTGRVVYLYKDCGYHEWLEAMAEMRREFGADAPRIHFETLQ